MAELRINADKLGAIIEMARQIEAQVEAPGRPVGGRSLGEDSGDDSYLGAMEDNRGVLYDQLSTWVSDFSPGEIADLLALQRLGRGDYVAEEWQDAQRRADEDVETRGYSVDRILQNDPQLADYLETGLELLGFEAPDDIDAGADGLDQGPQYLR